MPGRKIPLITNQFYHVLNRGSSLQPTFTSKRGFQRAIELMRYYQNKNLPLRYSQFLALSNKRREKILEILVKKKEFLVEITAYCLMPNHFHFLLKQVEKEGISKFLSNFTNSYTRYFNVKNKRNGPLFQGKFKAIRVETNKQLLHLSRYIHLNPYSSYVVKTPKALEKYSYSSLLEYLGKFQIGLCSKNIILGQFKNINLYKNFVFDQADYQRKLQRIKHLMLEK
ncbi:transposase [Candidatus Microgenomates bacterium]|nr:transposase [Candidatus Microgenomates bacterium]